jgi:hypothetical protein
MRRENEVEEMGVRSENESVCVEDIRVLGEAQSECEVCANRQTNTRLDKLSVYLQTSIGDLRGLFQSVGCL